MNPFVNNRNLGTSSFRTPVTAHNSPTGQSWGGKAYVGPRMDIKESDPAHKKPQRALTNPQARVFDMEDSTDVKDYQKVMQDVVTSAAHISTKELLKDRKPFCVYLEWYSDSYIAPEKGAK
jgi:hypothetical protein